MFLIQSKARSQSEKNVIEKKNFDQKKIKEFS